MTDIEVLEREKQCVQRKTEINCSDCAHEGKTVHDVLLCTGFNGSMEQYTENWKRKQMAKLGGERE